MAQKSIRPSRPAMIVRSVRRADDRWVIEAESQSMPRCPSCGTPSERQHSWYQRIHLPMQGVPVVIRLRVRKWRCQSPACDRSIFAERLPELASPHAHQTDVIGDILAVMGHGAGGEMSRKLPRGSISTRCGTRTDCVLRGIPVDGSACCDGR
jgi:hypothetical protein